MKPPKRAQSGATYDDVDPFEFGQDQPFDEHASDIDYSAPQDQPSTGGYGSESDSSAHAQSQRKRKASEATASTDFYSQGQQQPSKRKKRVRAEGISSDEDEEDEDFDYEATKKRSAPKKESKSRVSHCLWRVWGLSHHSTTAYGT